MILNVIHSELMQITHNEHLSSRVDAIFANLDASYAAGTAMSSASKGTERELFVSNFLECVFPPHYRFCTGDITDSSNKKSGQVDVVLERADGFSFPFLAGGPRMFLAESVAAVIEVKSDVASQWGEVLSTAKKVKSLNRKFASDNLAEFVSAIESGTINFKSDDGGLAKLKLAQKNAEKSKGHPKIPVYAVGFQGWKKLETIQDKLSDSDVDGVFVLNERLFVGPLSSGVGLNSMLAFLDSIGSEFNKTSTRFATTLSYSISSG